MQLAELLEVAIEVAWVGGRTALGWFRNLPGVEQKPDGSPVTVADTAAETRMRELIQSRFPGHAVLGEEGGAIGPENAEIRWILDPIDGTRAFVAGVPLFGTLVAVEIGGSSEVGVIYHPALDEMVAAASGLGCRVNGRRCRVSDKTRLSEALVVCTNIADARRRAPEGWERLERGTALQRTWGDCYSYTLVATGRAEIAVDPVMNLWDNAALLPVVEEAGGRFTDWTGARTIHGGDALATNGHLHDAALALLRP
jgi:histidinol phosphatase-like enzyme (inositol monophosphatase family)